MAVHAQFGCFAGCLPGSGSFPEEQLFADGALLSVAENNCYHCPGVVSGAQSELTCKGSGGGVLPSSRKRGREADHLERYVTSSLSAALLPIPASRVVDSVATSTSGRTCAAGLSSAQQDVPVLSELCRRQGAEIDALVRAEWERLSTGLEHAWKRQCQELARLVAGAAVARGLRETEAQLEAARHRAAELEERLRQAAAESQAWCGLALGHEAVAAELRAALDHHLLLRAAAAPPAVEGFGESDSKLSPAAADDDAQSCCFEAAKDKPAAADIANAKWACKGCGEGEASVLLLPCRHLCLCKTCEPRTDACPVCLAVKNASIHVAAN